MTVIMPSGLFGPWLPGAPEPERSAGLRALAVAVACHCGSGHPAVDALRRAERDPGAADAALRAFDALPSLKRRHVLSVYIAVMSPGRGGR